VPVDWAYFNGFINTMSGLNGPQAMLILSSMLKALQEQNDMNPTSGCMGWSWDRTDPAFIVSPSAPLMFSGLPSSTVAALLNSYITSWLAVVSSYTPQQYYQGGQVTANDIVTPGLPFQNWAGDVAYAIPRLQYLGVRSTLTNALINWAATMWPSNGYNWSGLTLATCSINTGIMRCSSD
jgi:hypothetical protein